MTKVLVVGGGPAGLTALKHCLEISQIQPVLYEKEAEIGGIWNSISGLVWKNMTTNLSKYTCMFSDLPWKKDTVSFPTNQELFNYLKDYTEHFNLAAHIKCNTEVTKIEKQNNKKWSVSSNQSGKSVTELFDFVIICTGIFSKQTKMLDSDSEKVMNSKDYKTNEQFKNKDVVVVGGSFTGAQIAVDLASVAKSVTCVMRSSFWIFPRFLEIKVKNTPFELVAWKRNIRSSEEEDKFPTEDVNKKKNLVLSKSCQKQQTMKELAIHEDKFHEPCRFIVADSFVDMVGNGKINVIRCEKVGFENEELSVDGEILKSDKIITCTGYELNLPFFDESIQQCLCYKPDDLLQPVLLYKCTFHPKLENIGFVGIYRGPLFTVMELQARWIVSIISGDLKLPTEDIMNEGIKDEEKIRKFIPKLQNPHGDFIGLADSIAKEMKIFPEKLQDIKDTDPEIFDYLFNHSVISSHYRLYNQDEIKKNIAIGVIKELQNEFKLN